MIQKFLGRYCCVLLAAALLPALASAQHTITTVAGGGPNNLAAPNSSIGAPTGLIQVFGPVVYIADSKSNRILKVDPSGNITVVAGNILAGYTGDGGLATNAQLNAPAKIALDNTGNLYIVDTGNNVVREVVASTGNIRTVAGNGVAGFSGDGGPATLAQLNSPAGIFVDGTGNIFIADAGNNVIREVAAASGNIQTVAGNGAAGYSGDGGQATSAHLNSPQGVFLYTRCKPINTGDCVNGRGGQIITFWGIADTGNNVIRNVNTTTGVITTVAGNGTAGYTGDGGSPTSAELNMPAGVYVLSRFGSEFLPNGFAFFIADTNNHVVRKADEVTGKITTIAGNGIAGFNGDDDPATISELDAPQDLTAFADVFIADTKNFAVRRVSSNTGIIQSYAGNHTMSYSGDGAPGPNAQLGYPAGVASDSFGNVFIADTQNNVVREVVAATGVIQTVAGTGIAGFSGDGGPAVSAKLNGPQGVFVDNVGNLLIADTNNNVIRKVVAATGMIQTVSFSMFLALNSPSALSLDHSGTLLIADTGNNMIRTTAAILAGNFTPGYSGDGGPATSALLNSPQGICTDGLGNIYIADTKNHVIRKITAATGIIQTIVGNGLKGYGGDGFPAIKAELNSPVGVFVDPAGNIFIGDFGNHVVREVEAATGLIHTVAGNAIRGSNGDGGPATSAQLGNPAGVFGDPAGDLLIADQTGARVRRVTGLVVLPTAFALQVVKQGTGSGTITSDEGSINCGAACIADFNTGTMVTLSATPVFGASFDGWSGACSGTQTCTVTMNAAQTVSATFTQQVQTSNLRFIPVTPCRIADTRNPSGPFGGPFLGRGTSRTFVVPNSTCGVPGTAQAYSINATVVPKGPLGFLTIFPCGQLPLTSTLNSVDGRVKAGAAIVPAGPAGAVCAFAANDTELILDINGYFVPATSPAALAFYPVAPCRLVDTRLASGPLGGPSLTGGAARTFPLLSSSCNLPVTARAYSLNFTSVPKGSLGFLTAWPAGQTQPLVSTLNAPTGTITANAAIVPAGANGGLSVFVTNDSDLIIDVNGYFAQPGAGGLSLFTVNPCRVLDTRNPAGSPPFAGMLVTNVLGSGCGASASAQAYVLNATVIPSGPLGFLTLWPTGTPQPLVSTLNAADGIVTSNMAIVPTVVNGLVNEFAPSLTHLVLDISAYFAP